MLSEKAKGNGGVLIIPENIKEIRDDCFQDKEYIKEVRIETSEVKIGNDIFKGSPSIKAIYTKDIKICNDICKKSEYVYKRALENKLDFYVDGEKIEEDQIKII